ncbi:peptidyl-prolyl cis-trans isomerase sig-7-like [Convolutriloba macropyga]|uniref:peptidyl-prolyl cis-trans isomerase sig-7-like n=1 Tax=Convolutriloba macropyga TaxID=536237 RepID=UPI003F524248
MSVLLETTLGDIVIDLFVTERSRSCQNFLKLCKMKYYNFCAFHFVKRNFIAQTGDPSGRGDGGESIFSHVYGPQAVHFEGERKPRIKHSARGTVSMVNRDSVASQFFITLGSDLDYLDEKHLVIGVVTEGMETLEKINEVLTDDDNRPYQDIRISHTVILDDPFEDPPDLRFPSRSPSPSREVLESERMCIEDEIADEQAKTTEQLDEEYKEKEARAQAQVLEMLGDLPTADVKPPENVLFVCKLNPATCSEDLHVIFSRFGEILSCEVIRDWKTGNSLQYAFIEFDKEEDCESAYFKMDNVLIDDRRIHVDFSQSVAKSRWQQFLKQRNSQKPSKDGNGQNHASVGRKLASALSDDEMESNITDKKLLLNGSGRSRKNEENSKQDESSSNSSNAKSNDRSKIKHGNRSRSPREENYRDRSYNHRNDYDHKKHHLKSLKNVPDDKNHRSKNEDHKRSRRKSHSSSNGDSRSNKGHRSLRSPGKKHKTSRREDDRVYSSSSSRKHKGDRRSRSR